MATTRDKSFIRQLQEDTMPLLLQYGQKKQKEKAQQERLSAIQTNLGVVLDKNVPRADKIAPFSTLSSLGVNLPMSYLEETKDYTEILKSFNADNRMIKGYQLGLITAKDVLLQAVNNDGKTDYTVQDFQNLIDIGAYEDDPKLRNYTAEQHKTLWDMRDALKGVKREDAEDTSLEDSVYSKVDQGFTAREDFSSEEWGWIHDNFKTKEAKDAFFGVKYDKNEIVKTGNNAVQAEMDKLWPLGGLGFTNDLQGWTMNTMADPVKAKFFNKFYNKNGELNYESIAKEGKIVLAQVEDYAREANLDYNEKIQAANAVSMFANLSEEKIRNDWQELIDNGAVLPFSQDVLEVIISLVKKKNEKNKK